METPFKKNIVICNMEPAVFDTLLSNLFVTTYKHHLEFFPWLLGRAQRAAADKMAMKLLLLETKAWREFVFGQVTSQSA